MMHRRGFLRSVAGLGAASAASPGAPRWARASAAYFGLHPFIEAHPEAVFIRTTAVTSKDDGEGKRNAAFELGKRIFTAQNSPGIDVAHRFVFKPNLTSTAGSGLTYAIVTDPYVIEGLIGGLTQAGVGVENIYVREGLWPDQPGVRYHEMAARSGVHYSDSDSREPTPKECPDGVISRRTKYLGPFNYPDTHLINVSKMKAHSMGLTLCMKNLQGTNIHPYMHFCGGVDRAIAKDLQPDAQAHVDDLFAKHQKAGIPRWDTGGSKYMEAWVHRTLDSYSLIRSTILLNMVEGIYAQNGGGFTLGPGRNGAPEIFLTNVLIFGKDPFRTDIIGHWLGGHEPGNFGLFHIAKERGFSTALNPHNIPVYRWEDSGPKLTRLEQFPRTPLATPYLMKPGEARFHLCNEPFAYPAEPVSACLSGHERPGLRVLGHNRMGTAGGTLLVQYDLPAEVEGRVEVYDIFGERVGVLADGRLGRGVHLVEWSTQGKAPGLYCCRLKALGTTLTEAVWV